MNYEKMVLGNFRTSFKYSIYLINYYQPVLITLCGELDPRTTGEYNDQYDDDKRVEQFDGVRFAASIMESPFAKNYASFAKLVLKELSRQTKQLYNEPENIALAENVFNVFRAIYDAIEQLPEDERIVIKILFTVDHVEIAKKFLQFVNVTGLKDSALEKLKGILTYEAFWNLEEWLKTAGTIVASQK
jgi:hypothetical protein